MTTPDEIRDILSEVEFRGWEFALHLGERWYLQVCFEAPCSRTGELKQQRGRKWMLSPHMTRSEIVSTALKAVLTALEHEAREDFRYKGIAIYNPHIDVQALVMVAPLADERREIALSDTEADLHMSH